MVGYRGSTTQMRLAYTQFCDNGELFQPIAYRVFNAIKLQKADDTKVTTSMIFCKDEKLDRLYAYRSGGSMTYRHYRKHI